MTNKVNATSSAALSATSAGNGSIPDPDMQAALDLGELAFLANTYEDLLAKGAPQALLDKTLAEFQKLASYYHISGNTITFDYNEGAQPGVAITNPEVIEMLQHMPTMSNPPTAADLSNYLTSFWNSTTPITWKDGQSMPIVGKLLSFLYDSRYTMENNQENTVTNTSLLLFYCSLANNPEAAEAGTLSDLLGEGYYDGGLFNLGNIYAMAATLRDHLANDTTLLDPSVVQAGLSIQTATPLYSLLGQTFQTLMAEPLGDESVDWALESRFFPFYPANETKLAIDTLPNEDTQLQNRTELEKKAMEKQDKDPAIKAKKNKS